MLQAIILARNVVKLSGWWGHQPRRAPVLVSPPAPLNLSSTINMQFAGRGGLFSPPGRDAEGREGNTLYRIFRLLFP